MSFLAKPIAQNFGTNIAKKAIDIIDIKLFFTKILI